MARKPHSNGSAHATRQHLTFDYVKGVARGRWPEIVARVYGVDPDYLTGNHGPCPKCGGTDRWRFTNLDDSGAAICTHCGKFGDGFKLGDWLINSKPAETLRRVAEFLNLDSPGHNGNGRSSKTLERVDLEPLNDLLATYWCARKSPISLAGLSRCQAQHGKCRGIEVLSIPAYGPELASSPPVRYTLFRADGGLLPRWEKDPSTNRFKHVANDLKSRVTSGGSPGLHGPVDELATATHVWKLEGPSDLLAFYSAFGDTLPAGHVAITNANGAGENPQRWMLELLTGKTVYVLHDADKPGQTGAPKWSTTAAPALNILLPYPVAENHGSDFRDWLNDGITAGTPRTFADLLTLVATSSTPLPPLPLPDSAQDEAAIAAADDLAPNEALDDPHRLARVNLDRYAALTDGGTIRHWRNEWYIYKHNRYRKLEAKEFAAKVGLSIKEEFNRANIIAQQIWEEKKRNDPEFNEPRPEARKVTQTLINNVVHATAGMQMTSGNLELNTDLEAREPRNWISLANGIVDVDALLNDEDEASVLLPHTPNWFSTICLSYDFDPAAQCPRWEAFLHRCMNGDQELIAILQEWAGYLLLPNTNMQKFLINEGEGGNGKSVYSAGIQALIGVDNCSFVSFERFGDRFALGSTLGKLVNVIDDMGEMDRVAEGHLKWFTSGQMFNIDRKGIAAIDCLPTARIMCNTNVRPRFADKSAALWRRMLLIPWEVRITKAERVIGMDKSQWWHDSGELPGIFLWAIRGLHRLRMQKDFTFSQKVEDGIADYRKETNPAREFLFEHVELAAQGHVKCIDLYSHYRRWTDKHGYHPLGERQFGKEIRRCFDGVERKKGGPRSDRFWYYAGLRYSTDEICGEKTDDSPLF